MLSKNQANKIAEDIIRQAELSNTKNRKFVSIYTSLLYRCRELYSLKPWQRVEVVRQATNEVSTNRLFLFLIFSWLGLISFWFFSLTTPARSQWLFSYMFACCSVTLILRVVFIRHEVRKIANELRTFD